MRIWILMSAMLLSMGISSQSYGQYAVGLDVSYIECQTQNRDKLGTDYIAYKIGRPFKRSSHLSMEVWQVGDSSRQLIMSYFRVSKSVDSKKVTTIDSKAGLVLKYSQARQGEFTGQAIDFSNNEISEVTCQKIE